MCAANANMAARRVLITGGSGFIAANLARRLLTGNAAVHLLLRPNSALWRVTDLIDRTVVHLGDMTDRHAIATAFARTSPEVVFHLATPRGDDSNAWTRLVHDNVVVALNLVDALRSHPQAEVVVAGSSLEYGDETPWHREADALYPSTWHGVGKAAATSIYHHATRSMGLPITVLRLFHVYGPWEFAHRLLPTAIRAALSGQSLPLSHPGIRRDWVYVGDVVDALCRAAQAGRHGEIFNIGSGEETSNEEVVALLEQCSGQTIDCLPGVFNRRQTDAAHRCANMDKTRTVLGWAPRHSLRAGIEATLNWYREHPWAWSCPDQRPPTVS